MTRFVIISYCIPQFLDSQNQINGRKINHQMISACINESESIHTGSSHAKSFAQYYWRNNQ